MNSLETKTRFAKDRQRNAFVLLRPEALTFCRQIKELECRLFCTHRVNLMKIFFAMTLFVSVLNFPTASANGQGDTKDNRDTLKFGSHDVGFRTIFSYDISRPAIPYSDWDGKLYPTRETKGRQMQINVWFPATATKQSSRIRFQHYVELTGRQIDFGPLSEKSRKFTDEQFIKKVNALGGNGTFNAKKLDKLKVLKTGAWYNAKPVDKKFPLIVFPNGGSPAFQSVMCEYFASHGFVVAAVVLKGQHAFGGDISVRGIETVVDDLGFAINKLMEIPQVNKDQIGLIGNGFASSQIVAYQTRNANVDCIVSLDGGLLSQFEQEILKRTAFYSPEAVNVPILAIHSPHPSIDPKHISHLKYADHYVFHFPKLSEFHYLNFGPFESQVPNIIGKPKGDVKRGHAIASQYCLNFFKAILLKNKNCQDFLAATHPPTEFRGHVKETYKRKGIATPPNIANLKNAFFSKGFDSIEQIYRKLKPQNKTPFSREFYKEMRDWLAWKKDPKYENRFRLYKLAVDSYPDSAIANYYFAYFAMKSGKKKISKEYNEKALRLLEIDNDDALTFKRKARMKAYILEDLKTLNGDKQGRGK